MITSGEFKEQSGHFYHCFGGHWCLKELRAGRSSEGVSPHVQVRTRARD